LRTSRKSKIQVYAASYKAENKHFTVASSIGIRVYDSLALLHLASPPIKKYSLGALETVTLKAMKHNAKAGALNIK
jgi:hypothetical protein